MSRSLLAAVMLLGLVGAPACPAHAEDEPAVLVRALLAAEPAARAVAEAALRARGTTCVKALREARERAGPGGRAVLDRVLVGITQDFHRGRLPEGMLYVPAGRLELPRSTSPWGPSGTRVDVPAFYIDRTEVTVAAWRAWLAALDARAAGTSQGDGLWHPPKGRDGTLPVTRVRFIDAERFAKEARRGRLPRAEEFERALRGSGLAAWPWGGTMRKGLANLRDYGPGAPVPVGTYPKGAGPFGALDLVGNVAEWSATTVAQGRRGRYPLVLGGSFRDAPSAALTWRGLSRMQARVGPRERREWIGFRVVRDVPGIPD